MRRLLELGLMTAVLSLAACGGAPETGPGPIRWDRVTCERCGMAVSDHHFSAEVRGGAPGGKTALHFFDDFGCAVLWLAEQSWRDDRRTEIWVTDRQDGSWRDARRVWFVPGLVTPMDYGLGAQSDSTAGAYDFERAVAEVHHREATLH